MLCKYTNYTNININSSFLFTITEINLIYLSIYKITKIYLRAQER